MISAGPAQKGHCAHLQKLLYPNRDSSVMEKALRADAESLFRVADPLSTVVSVLITAVKRTQEIYAVAVRKAISQALPWYAKSV